jgi:hypothetical protein
LDFFHRPQDIVIGDIHRTCIQVSVILNVGHFTSKTGMRYDAALPVKNPGPKDQVLQD